MPKKAKAHKKKNIEKSKSTHHNNTQTVHVHVNTTTKKRAYTRKAPTGARGSGSTVLAPSLSVVVQQPKPAEDYYQYLRKAPVAETPPVQEQTPIRTPVAVAQIATPAPVYHRTLNERVMSQPRKQPKTNFHNAYYSADQHTSDENTANEHSQSENRHNQPLFEDVYDTEVSHGIPQKDIHSQFQRSMNPLLRKVIEKKHEEIPEPQNENLETVYEQNMIREDPQLMKEIVHDAMNNMVSDSGQDMVNVSDSVPNRKMTAKEATQHARDIKKAQKQSAKETKDKINAEKEYAKMIEEYEKGKEKQRVDEEGGGLRMGKHIPITKKGKGKPIPKSGEKAIP